MTLGYESLHNHIGIVPSCSNWSATITNLHRENGVLRFGHDSDWCRGLLLNRLGGP
jgi:hypothetical protein